MRTQTLIALSCTCVALLSACRSEPERPDPPKGYFATHIEADGTKKFQYTVEVPERPGGRPNQRPGGMSGHVAGSSGGGLSGGVTAGTGRRPPGGQGGGYDPFEQINTRLENALEMELLNSGFCHEGHREIERSVKPPVVFIRGECQDKASDEDRKNFPNGA